MIYILRSVLFLLYILPSELKQRYSVYEVNKVFLINYSAS